MTIDKDRGFVSTEEMVDRELDAFWDNVLEASGLPVEDFEVPDAVHEKLRAAAIEAVNACLEANEP